MTTYIIRDITYSGRRTVEGSLADIISYYWPNGISVSIETIDELVRALNASFAARVPGRRFERAVRASARHTIASEANRERAEKAERRRIEAERREAEARVYNKRASSIATALAGDFVHLVRESSIGPLTGHEIVLDLSNVGDVSIYGMISVLSNDPSLALRSGRVVVEVGAQYDDWDGTLLGYDGEPSIEWTFVRISDSE